MLTIDFISTSKVRRNKKMGRGIMLCFLMSISITRETVLPLALGSINAKTRNHTIYAIL